VTMPAPETPIVNIADVPLRDFGKGEKFAAKLARIAPMVGSTGLGCTLTVVPPGKRAFPFHRHHVIHEMFFVLSGTGEYRLGDKTHPLRAGDVIAAPAGGAAHQIINTGSEDLRYLGLSTLGEVDVVDYPDSGKMAVAAGIKNADFTTATYRGMGRIAAADYWDGEAA
jgi:uncharacterized cupin superfamily protein